MSSWVMSNLNLPDWMSARMALSPAMIWASSFLERSLTEWSMVAWAMEPTMSCLARRWSKERDSTNWTARASWAWPMRACQDFCWGSFCECAGLGFLVGMGTPSFGVEGLYGGAED